MKSKLIIMLKMLLMNHNYNKILRIKKNLEEELEKKEIVLINYKNNMIY